MSKPAMAAVLTACIALGLVVAQPTRGLEPPAEESATARFDGKLLLVYFKGRSADFAFTLEKSRFTEVEGIKMLSARHAKTDPEEDWLAGTSVLAPLDAIESITIFDSVEAYQKATTGLDDQSL